MLDIQLYGGWFWREIDHCCFDIRMPQLLLDGENVRGTSSFEPPINRDTFVSPK